MTDEEAHDLYHKLLGELSKRHEAEVTTERDDYLKAIQAEIAAGKPVQVTLRVRGEKTVRDPVVGSRRTEATSSGEFIQRQEYTAKEKLGILIDGLSLAIIAPPLMARAFAAMVTDLNEKAVIPHLQMGNDQTSEPLRLLDTSSIETDVTATAGLLGLLQEVRGELSNQSSSSTHVETEE